MDGANVRAFTPADMDAVVSFDQAVFADDAWSPDVISAAVDHPSVQLFVAELEIDGAIEFAGYCALYVSSRSGAITTIGVEQEYRRMGLGRLMMESMIDASRHAGVTNLKLWVRPGNRSAVRLYEKIGFCVTGRVDNFYESDDGEAQVMELSLQPS